MQIRKLFKAEVAHRLTSAYSKRCTGLHGHSYRFEIFLESPAKDEHQMVMDFKLLKERLYAFIDAFDHALLVSDEDTFLREVAPKLNTRYIILPYNPTAEMMASHIFTYAKHIGLEIAKAVVHETDTGCAVCEGLESGFEVDLEKVIYSKELGEKL